MTDPAGMSTMYRSSSTGLKMTFVSAPSNEFSPVRIEAAFGECDDAEADLVDEEVEEEDGEEAEGEEDGDAGAARNRRAGRVVDVLVCLMILGSVGKHRSVSRKNASVYSYHQTQNTSKINVNNIEAIRFYFNIGRTGSSAGHFSRGEMV